MWVWSSKILNMLEWMAHFSICSSFCNILTTFSDSFIFLQIRLILPRYRDQFCDFWLILLFFILSRDAFEVLNIVDWKIQFSVFQDFKNILRFFFRFYEFLSKAFAVSQLGRSICCFSTNLKVSCFERDVLKFLNIGG